MLTITNCLPHRLAFCQKHIFGLEMGQINSHVHDSKSFFSLVQSHVLQHFCSGVHRNENFEFLDKKVTYSMSLGFSVFLNFSWQLFFFSFSYLFAAANDILLGLLPAQKILRKHPRNRQIFPWSNHVQSQVILLQVFHPNF